MYLPVYTYISHLSISYECCNVMILLANHVTFDLVRNLRAKFGNLSHCPNKPRNHDLLQLLLNFDDKLFCFGLGGVKLRKKLASYHFSLMNLNKGWKCTHIHQNEAYTQRGSKLNLRHNTQILILKNLHDEAYRCFVKAINTWKCIPEILSLI